MEAKNIQSKKANKHGWHTNTDLGCDLKTILRNDRRMKVGKDYQGVLVSLTRPALHLRRDAALEHEA